MGKHLGLKAFVLLVVIFFHSFVLIPKSYAGMGTVVDISVARQAFRSIAPSVVKATPAGRGYLIGYAVVSGIAYVAVKSGAVSALKTWVDTLLSGTPSQGTSTHVDYAAGTQGLINSPYGAAITFNTYDGTWIAWRHTSSQATGYQSTYSWQYSYSQPSVLTTHLLAYQYLFGGGSSPAVPPPTVPTDYGTPLTTSQPDFPSGSVKFSPGGAALLNGANNPETVVEKSDEELEGIAGALGMTEVSPEGQQAGDPATNDNTVTEGDSTQIGYLRQMLYYLTNLIGIKTDTGVIKTNTDNMVAGQSLQTTAINTMAGKMDNIAIAINTQTEIDNQILTKMDNVAQTVETLKNTTASQSSLSSRVGEVKDLLLTKFPFSIVAVVTSPGEVSGGTYSIPDLQFPLGTSISVDPLENDEIHSWVTWLRGLMAVGMWAIFVLVMVRRVTEI